MATHNHTDNRFIFRIRQKCSLALKVRIVVTLGEDWGGSDWESMRGLCV
jgi:hypothetical protein